jgi:hypothetical protein
MLVSMFEAVNIDGSSREFSNGNGMPATAHYAPIIPDVVRFTFHVGLDKRDGRLHIWCRLAEQSAESAELRTSRRARNLFRCSCQVSIVNQPHAAFLSALTPSPPSWVKTG